MASQNFFRNVFINDPFFFDEGPKQRVTGSLKVDQLLNATGSINTSLIDGYRQGVELTLQKHFDAGTVKIHAGEPGHILRRNHFGEERTHRTTSSWFQEVDYFNPTTFLKNELDLESIARAITFPIITSDNDQLENFTFDGIIEPFTIRARASFFSIDIPIESHEVKGCLMDGNSDITLASDRVLTVDYFTPNSQQIFYLDMVDMFSGSSTPLGGLFETRKLTVLPFEDRRFVCNASYDVPSGTISGTLSPLGYDPLMSASMSLMTGSTDNYITFKKRSATCGWSYDQNASIGTDSIVFGGMLF